MFAMNLNLCAACAQVALRWRTEAEVVSGKGQFVCGEKHCSRSELALSTSSPSEPASASSAASSSKPTPTPERVRLLRTWEVNFAYVEHGVKKNALIKLRARL